MSSPIERLYCLKADAMTQGISIDRAKFVAGVDFMAELEADPSIKWVLPGTFKKGVRKAFGIPIEENEGLPPDELRLAFELDG